MDRLGYLIEKYDVAEWVAKEILDTEELRGMEMDDAEIELIAWRSLTKAQRQELENDKYPPRSGK